MFFGKQAEWVNADAQAKKHEDRKAKYNDRIILDAYECHFKRPLEGPQNRVVINATKERAVTMAACKSFGVLIDSLTPEAIQMLMVDSIRPLD